MANNKNITRDNEKTRFSSINQPQKRGRKPNKLKKYIKEYDLSSDDVIAVIQHILFAHSPTELDAIEADDKTPAFIVYIIRLLKTSTERGNANPLAYLIDRWLGRPNQQVNVSETLSAIPVDPQERQELREKLLKDLQLMEIRHKAQTTENRVNS